MPRALLLTRRLFSKISFGNLAGLVLASQSLGVSRLAATATETATGEPGQAEDTTPAAQPKTAKLKSRSTDDEIDYLRISDAEWKKRLSASQYNVARKHGTERAFSGKYHNYKKDGAYRCVCCKTVLFDSEHKFDSGTGWPSFWQPRVDDVVAESSDRLLGYPRTEVHCKRCHAHLGHIFQDAPKTPTGLRYCINSVCLDFMERKDVEGVPN